MMKIDEALLARAVGVRIRPLLVDQKYLENPKEEGYHHLKVIAKARPLLAADVLSVESVIQAMHTHVNLLSVQEIAPAVDFLRQADSNNARAQMLDLLYGGDPLLLRVRKCLEWSKLRKDPTGTKNLGFNATVVSYLLAVSDPERYAFCKPTVYKPAAAALLGKDQVEKNPVTRLEHCTEFYTASLRLFRDNHQLPFSDLMHCHIAFFIMAQKDPPNWTTLTDPNAIPYPSDEKDDSVEASATPLNVILYGPPGTGKTYHAIERAVRICDGQVPTTRPELVARFNALRADGRVEMVTFHQSYSYEEFVEGIRPVIQDDEDAQGEEIGSEIRYECRPGIFKRLARMAKQPGVRASLSLKSDVSKQRVWKMSLANIDDPDLADIYDECIHDKLIRLGYGQNLDFGDCNDEASIEQKLSQEGKAFKAFSVQAVNRLKNQMKTGDLVVVSDGNYKFRAIGRVRSDKYIKLPVSTYPQAREVEWLLVLDESLPVERILNKIFSRATIYQLKPDVLRQNALSELLSGAPASPLNYVLIIDEINRGNISKILGELITLIEPDKRLGAANEMRVTLPYSQEPFGVPPNLYILGTMNTADRSIAFLDTALRRRFRFEELMPDVAVIRQLVGDKGVVDGVDVAELLEAINRWIELLFDRDHQVGHAYFLQVKSLSDLREVLHFSVLPLLQEYFYGDWSKVCRVLGCPYDAEDGKLLLRNDQPMIIATALRLDEDASPRLRCQVNPAFLAGDTAYLQRAFGFMATPAGGDE